ncbi:hypothetical protein E3C22_07810 [Jiella endophytica]|uniref:Uncharacterized protein n=1 Tax=Jiella endophytica TaxID=2558362 RepID=A0A4Y8RNW1_9HYPH|nr:hypothetical protein [Jiella endophytica]TFF25269.1 hypothetical protein E3C22_07810 [Jiella endophytica]
MKFAAAAGIAAVALSTLFVWAGSASAKSARCFTTDDGSYPCDFRGTDGSGSFEISAPGKPTFSLVIREPGLAGACGDFGTGRCVPMPGVYLRERDQPACWSNPETNTKICAW